MRRRVAKVAVSLLVAWFLPGCEKRVEPPLEVDPSSRRTISSGWVVGATGQYGSHVWRGIPYAKPPVGDLRWRATEPPEPWIGTRETLASGRPCPQFPSIFAGVAADDPDDPVGDEDCLFLDVYAPAFAKGRVPRGDDRLPVMVWIHGGGNVIGLAGFYDGGNLAATENVVVVAMNYRLGPLGWFLHDSLRKSASSPADASGNFGTLDQIRALEWVRDDVAAFGGDPDNVTIFGESAGGRDVFALLVSPMARGLFHRAIVQSGGTSTTPPVEAEGFLDAEPPGHRNSSSEILLRLLRRDLGELSRAEAKARLAEMSDRDVEAYLRGKNPDELLRMYRSEDLEGLIDVPQLFADGVVLPDDDPLEVIARGGHNAVPTILGTNRDENRLFLAVNSDFVRNLFGILPRVRDWDRYEATADHLSSLWKATGVDAPATELAAAQEVGVWAYRFDWDEEPKSFLVDVSRLLGAAHGFEIPFVFGHWDLGEATGMFFGDESEPGRLELSRRMMDSWGSFARSGDPGGGGRRPHWRRWEPDDPQFLVFDTREDGGVRMASGRVTVDDVVAAVASDERLDGVEARCDVYRRLVEWGRGLSREDYPKLADGRCAEFPLPEPAVR